MRRYFAFVLLLVVAGCQATTGTKEPPAVRESIASDTAKTGSVPTVAVLHVQGKPDGANVSIDGTSIGVLPLTVELPPGERTISVSASGFVSKEQTVTGKPGDDLLLVFDLTQAEGPVVDVHFLTKPEGGDVLFQGRSLDAKLPQVAGLPAGSYQVQAQMQKDELNRLSGMLNFQVTESNAYSGKPLRIVIPLIKHERLYLGEWLDAQEAFRREAHRYAAERAPNPVAVRVRLNEKERKALANDPHLEEALNSILRVGDRIWFEKDGNRWVVWKRHTETTPEFKRAIAAFRAGTKVSDEWRADTAKMVNASASLDAIALALGRGLGDSMLDLSQSQLSPNGETIQRVAGDGILNVVAVGGNAVKVNGVQIKSHGPLSLVRIPSGDTPVEISWQTRPSQLVVATAKRLSTVSAPQPGDPLKANEKRIVQVSGDKHVVRLVRLTNGPDYRSWQRETVHDTGPLAGQLDLSQDELGPNGAAGEYRRDWIVVLKTGNGETQRQVGCSYQVLNEIYDPTSDRFLRRSKLAAPQPKGN